MDGTAAVLSDSDDSDDGGDPGRAFRGGRRSELTFSAWPAATPASVGLIFKLMGRRVIIVLWEGATINAASVELMENHFYARQMLSHVYEDPSASEIGMYEDEVMPILVRALIFRGRRVWLVRHDRQSLKIETKKHLHREGLSEEEWGRMFTAWKARGALGRPMLW